MRIFLVTIKKKYGFSSKSHVLQSHKGFIFYKFIDKGYENA